MKRVVEIVVNKNWETEPFLSAITNFKLRPESLMFPTNINAPKDAKYRSNEPRAVIELSAIKIIIRCIEDLMNVEKNPSNSEEKYRVLPKCMAKDQPDLVISVSTAESTPIIQHKKEISQNGSVYIGGNFYLFDARSFDPTTESKLDVPDVLLENNVENAIFDIIDDGFNLTVAGKFIAPRNHPASDQNLKCNADRKYVSIGVVNVMDYQRYTKADPAAYEAFVQKYGTTAPAATIETTHGIVKMSAQNTPILFVSPITDRYESFDEDVTDTQNYIAAFNAGIAMAEFLVRLNWYYK